jgi:hypothetical protein
VTPYQFAKRLEKLADATEDLCQELAEKSMDLIQDGFKYERDPRGVAWAPRRSGERAFNPAVFSGGSYRQRRNSGGHPLLDKSHTFKNGFVIAGVNKNGFGITNDTYYGGFLHEGTKFMPRRRVVPDKADGLGTWAEPLQEVARAFIRKRLT